MLRLASYDIVFQEVPGEVTLALNLSACPNRCPGCHSPHLREAIGELLDDTLLEGLLSRYGSAVTCVTWMGGDGDPAEVNRQAALVHEWRGSGSDGSETTPDGPKTAVNTSNPTPDGEATAVPRLKSAWYSGRGELPPDVELANFDFIKLGPYDPERGGLSSPGTNQRFYRIESDGDGVARMVDATSFFRHKPLQP